MLCPPASCLCSSSSLIHSLWSSNISSTSSVVSPSCSVVGIRWLVLGLVKVSGGCVNLFHKNSCWSCRMGASSSGVIPHIPAADSGWIWVLGAVLSGL